MSDITVRIKYEGSDEEYTAYIAELDWDKITYIYALHKRLMDLKWMKDCPNLQYLNISNNKLTSLNSLPNCPNLQILHAWNNNLSSLDSFPDCPNLQNLDISYNKLTSLNGLQNFPNLRSLWASSNNLSSLDGLQNCLNLHSLSVSYNNLSSLDDLSNCSALQCLNISNNKLTSLDGLQNFPNLQVLDISYNNLSSLDGLQNCPNLQELDISNNNLTSLDGLPNYPNLQTLSISNNNLTSLDGLQNCPKLQYLDISYNTQITTLPNFLIEFRHLIELYYNGLELELEPRMRRWLNRLQNHGSTGIQVYGNSQNVHDSSIQESVRASMRRLLNQVNLPKQCLDTLRAEILKDCILTKKSKEQLLTYIESTEELHELCLTYSELLWVVWQTIDTFPEETQKEIKLVLNQELEDGDCKCFTGRMSRLVNCLSGFSPLVEVKILDSAQIGNIVVLIKNRLEDSEEGYTVEKHKKEFRKEMLDRGESVRLIDEWVEYIE